MHDHARALRSIGAVQEGLHRGLAKAPTSLIWPRLIVFVDPRASNGRVLERTPVQHTGMLQRMATGQETMQYNPADALDRFLSGMHAGPTRVVAAPKESLHDVAKATAQAAHSSYASVCLDCSHERIADLPNSADWN